MAEARTARAGGGFWQWVRHHLASIGGTIADFGLMVTCVEVLGLRPVPATAVGALAGAVTNFALARLFAYRVSDQRVAGQSWRYALVSVASLGLNAAGEHLFSNVIGLHYLLARVITSVIVSNAWNYPMQRFFVFSRRRAQPAVPQP